MQQEQGTSNTILSKKILTIYSLLAMR